MPNHPGVTHDDFAISSTDRPKTDSPQTSWHAAGLLSQYAQCNTDMVPSQVRPHPAQVTFSALFHVSLFETEILALREERDGIVVDDFAGQGLVITPSSHLKNQIRHCSWFTRPPVTS